MVSLGSPGVSDGVVLSKPLKTHDHDRCRECQSAAPAAQRNFSLLCTTDTLHSKPAYRPAAANSSVNRDGAARLHRVVFGTKSRERHVTPRRGEPEALPRFRAVWRWRPTHGSAAALQEPGLPSERKAPLVRFHSRAQSELRPGRRRSRGQDQPHRELHHQRVSHGVCSHGVWQLHRWAPLSAWRGVGITHSVVCLTCRGWSFLAMFSDEESIQMLKCETGKHCLVFLDFYCSDGCGWWETSQTAAVWHRWTGGFVFACL